MQMQSTAADFQTFRTQTDFINHEALKEKEQFLREIVSLKAQLSTKDTAVAAANSEADRCRVDLRRLSEVVCR